MKRKSRTAPRQEFPFAGWLYLCIIGLALIVLATYVVYGCGCD